MYIYKQNEAFGQSRKTGIRGKNGISKKRDANYLNPVIQKYDWLGSTPLSTLSDFVSNPNWEGAKDLYDPRRWRLNPLNMYEGKQNYDEETAANSNYHTSSKHGAHNTIGNVMGRLLPRPTPGRVLSDMVNKYNETLVDHQARQGRFNSEAWEAYSWRKAMHLFEQGLPAGTVVNWVSSRPVGIAGANVSTWRAIMDFPNEDVGVSATRMGVAGVGPINSVSGVKVAINYTLMPPAALGAPVQITAWNGQMFPSDIPVGLVGPPIVGGIAIGPVIPGGAGVVRVGHPASAHNGDTIVVAPPVTLTEKMAFRLGLDA